MQSDAIIDSPFINNLATKRPAHGAGLFILSCYKQPFLTFKYFKARVTVNL
jgi:hypothetical protein